MIDRIKDTAINAALEAGRILKEGYGTNFEISLKSGKNNLVTEFDHKAENTIIDLIKHDFSRSSFLAEESGYEANDRSDLFWIIDPLDGTVNFAHSVPLFSVSIAAEKDGEIVCGVIYQPMLDELFVATKGGGAFLNGKQLKVSRTTDIERSYLVTGFPYDVDKNPCNCIDLFVSIVQRGIPIRRLGSAALDLAYVAAGRFDGFWEIDLKPWDIAAGILLVKEAGGTITQFNNDDHSLSSNTILATNGILHGQVSDILSTCNRAINES